MFQLLIFEVIFPPSLFHWVSFCCCFSSLLCQLRLLLLVSSHIKKKKTHKKNKHSNKSVLQEFATVTTLAQEGKRKQDVNSLMPNQTKNKKHRTHNTKVPRLASQVNWASKLQKELEQGTLFIFQKGRRPKRQCPQQKGDIRLATLISTTTNKSVRTNKQQTPNNNTKLNQSHTLSHLQQNEKGKKRK